MRIRPYITVDNKIDGAVVAIVDIDQVKRASEQIKNARDRADAIVETVWQPLVVLDSELRVMRANRAFLQLLGRHRRRSRAGRSPSWARSLGRPGLLAELREIPRTGQPLPMSEIETSLGSQGDAHRPDLRLPDRLG